jgi:hypothetical protein
VQVEAVAPLQVDRIRLEPDLRGTVDAVSQALAAAARD